MVHERPKADRRLVQIVDAALKENAARCGDWLACRPGCFQCCLGVFEISQLDAVRLRDGLAELERRDPKRAAAVRKRAEDSRRRLRESFPGNSWTGILNEDEEAFAEFGNDEVCPVLDPETGMCDLYEHRPMTCRVFGPPVWSDGGLGVCELCFEGASEDEIIRCALVTNAEELESKITRDFELKSGRRGSTVVAWALLDLGE